MPAPVVLRRGKVTFAEIASSALAYSKAMKRSYQTDVPRFARLKEWFGKRPAEALTPLEIEDTLSSAATEERWAASTFNHYRSLVSLAYRLAIRNRKATMNPARSVSHPAKIIAEFGISQKKRRRDCVRFLNQIIRGICLSSIWRSTLACGKEASTASRGAW
jgi:hypothetical protein